MRAKSIAQWWVDFRSGIDRDEVCPDLIGCHAAKAKFNWSLITDY